MWTDKTSYLSMIWTGISGPKLPKSGRHVIIIGSGRQNRRERRGVSKSGSYLLNLHSSSMKRFVTILTSFPVYHAHQWLHGERALLCWVSWRRWISNHMRTTAPAINAAKPQKGNCCRDEAKYCKSRCVLPWRLPKSSKAVSQPLSDLSLPVVIVPVPSLPVTLLQLTIITVHPTAEQVPLYIQHFTYLIWYSEWSNTLYNAVALTACTFIIQYQFIRSWKALSAIILLALGLHFTSSAQIRKASLQAAGLTCAMLLKSHAGILKTLSFVDKIDTDLNATTFLLSFKPGATVNIDEIKAKVEDAGFSVAKLVLTASFDKVAVEKDAHIQYAGSTFTHQCKTTGIVRRSATAPW